MPRSARPSLVRLLVALQVFLLVTSLIAPVAALAEEPSADPSPSPTPSAEPSAEPTPEATPVSTPEATPSEEPTAEPTAESTPEATPEETAPPATPAPTAEPTPAEPVAAPTIASDLDDYPPGGLVTLTGSNWHPGEVVHIFVNDDWGSSWNRQADVTADTNGNITDQFNLPDWFVAEYSVVATGASGIATTTFTDANLRFLTSGPTLSAISWTKYTNTTCTVLLTPGQSGTGNITSNDGAGTTLQVAAESGQFVRLTAPASASGQSFQAWTATSGSGSFTTSDGGRTICAAGDNSSGLRRFTASYALVNDDPVANDDNATVAEDSVDNAINVLVNDNDGPDSGETLTVTAVTQGTNGSVTFTATGVKYTPNANFFGNDSFTYTISDGNGGTSTATVSVTVTNVNDDPVANDDNATVAEDSVDNAINVLVNDNDGPDSGETLTVTAVTQGTNGSVTFTATGVKYTPNANFFGNDSFTYTISDGNGGTSTATVSVTVTNVNDDPVANDDNATVAEDSVDNAINVLVNDNDGPDSGETLTVTAVTQGTNGSVTFTATGVKYTPNANFFGNDSFTYTISDGNGGTSTATVSVTVTNVNDDPVANDDNATVAEDSVDNAINVLVNDNDGPDSGETLTVTAVTQGTNGSVTFTATGVKYTPNANFFGNDSFTYTISDGNGGTSTATVSVTVTEVNDAPTAVNDTTTVAEDGTVTFDPRTNDSKGPANESTQTLTVTAVTQGTHGSVSFTAGTVTYTPDANYNGSDSFTYTITDNGTTNGANDFKTSTATVSVTVTEVNDAPTAVNDTTTVAEDGTVTFDPRTNDSKGPANESTQTLTVTAVTQGTHGSVSFTAGTVTYTPDANYNGSDSFTYTITDNGTTNGANDFKTSTATVSVTVTEVNDAPTAVNDTTTVAEDGTVTFDPRTNDSKGPANESTQTLTVTAVTQGTHGSVSFTAGTVTYTPDANYNGSDSFTYTITDNGTTNGANDFKTSTATVSVTVTEVNDAPTNASLSFDDDEIDESGSVTATLTFEDVDADQTHACTFEWDDGATETVNLAADIYTCSTSHTYSDDDPTGTASDVYSIKVTVTDNGTTNGADDFESDDDTEDVTVKNIKPTTSTPVFTFDPVTHVATATFQYADVGTQDTHLGSYINWKNGTTDLSPQPTSTVNPTTKTVTSTVTLPAACYNLNLTGYAVDDDLGITSQVIATNQQADAYTARFNAPIKDNERNIAKYGNVVPVKVELASNCNPGSTSTTPLLFITITLGNISGDAPDSTPVIVVESVSNADTENQMRVAGGGYIYNLSTKSLQAGKDYTIRIRSGTPTGPIILAAVFQPKKN